MERHLDRRRNRAPMASGLGWGDVGDILRAVEQAYGATVKVEVFTDGANYVGTVFVRVTATVPQLADPGLPLRAEKYSRWPTHQATTMEGLVVNLLHRLDHDLAKKVMIQQELPF